MVSQPGRDDLNITVVLLVLGAFFVAALSTKLILGVALERGMLDVPNARSSHARPTPRGGGAAMVCATLLAALAAYLTRILDAPLLIALTGGGLAVAVVGFIDDRRQVAAWLRLLIHMSAAAWAMYWLGGLPPLRLGEHLIRFGFAGYALGIIGIVWALNLFNFMDGIDGLAASEAGFVGVGAAVVIALFSAPAGGVAVVALVLAAAAAGFALWNWPPARIFMGDVGSGFLGFVIAVLAIAHARADASALFIWAILGASFIADSGVTLMRRLARGERLHEAHRSHAYQHLARRWNGHLPVTLLVIALDLFWLLPCALIAAREPPLSGAVAAIAYIPTILLVIAAGAGRRE